MLHRFLGRSGSADLYIPFQLQGETSVSWSAVKQFQIENLVIKYCTLYHNNNTLYNIFFSVEEPAVQE